MESTQPTVSSRRDVQSVEDLNFATFFAHQVEEMLAKSDAISPLSHPGLRGRFRELFVRELLEHVVPPSCSIAYGTVIDSSSGQRPPRDGHQPTEDDILVVDTECLPPFFRSGKEGIYPIESVLARVEVKSTLDSHSLAQAIKGARSFAGLKPALPDNTPTLMAQAVQILFAYRTSWDANSVFKEFKLALAGGHNAHCSEKELPVVRHLCVPRVGYWAYTRLNSEKDIGWHQCADQPNDDFSEVLLLIALLLQELPPIREARRKATLGRYIPCLRKGGLLPIP